MPTATHLPELTIEDYFAPYRNTARKFSTSVGKDARVVPQDDGGALVYEKKIRRGAQWIENWVQVSDEDALTHMYTQVPEQDRPAIAEKLVESINGIAPESKLASDRFLSTGCYCANNIICLFNELGISVGMLNAMFQQAIKDTNINMPAPTRPRG